MSSIAIPTNTEECYLAKEGLLWCIIVYHYQEEEFVATTYATIERMEGGRNVQSPLVSNDPFYLKYFSSIFEEF